MLRCRQVVGLLGWLLAAGSVACASDSAPTPPNDVVADAAGDTAGPPRLEDGRACNVDADCLSDHCVANVCCAAGGACCADAADCASQGLAGLACDRSAAVCFEACAAPGGGGDDDGRCAAGYHCDDGACVVDAPAGECDEGSDCASGECIGGHCCEHAGLCCLADAECPDFGAGCAGAPGYTCALAALTLPDTGQDRCFDADDYPLDCSLVGAADPLHGQDGHVAGPARGYVAAGSDAVDDVATGLSWRTDAAGPLAHAGAVAHCADLAGGWRLPGRHELQTLVDYGGHALGGLIDRDVFAYTSGAQTSPAWSRTGSAAAAERAWVVDFATGTIEQHDRSSLYAVRCVR